MNLHIVDMSIVGGYLVLCLVIGLFKFGKIKNIRDYTLGNKSFSTMVLFATTFATIISASRVVGNIGKIHKMGIAFMIPLFFFPVCWFIMARILAPNLEIFRKHKFISLSDIMEHWYGKTGRWVTNISAIPLAMGITAASATAIGYLLHYFMNIPEITGMVIGVGIVAFYSAFGGILSVAFTDVFQFFIFFIALPLACAVGYHNVEGLEGIIASLPDTHVTINTSNIVLFLSFIVFALVPTTGIPFVQRALMAKDEKQFVNTFTSVGIALVPFLVIICLIALITYKIDPNIKPDIAFYYFIDRYLFVGIKGLMIAGLLAVIMSTQDSYLNTTSVVISHDICKQLWPSLTDKQELLIARISCVGVAMLSILLILLQKGIMEIIWLVENFWMPIISVPFVAALIGVRGSKGSFATLVSSSFSALIITRLINGKFDTRSLSVGVITSIIVLYFSNRRYKKRHPELLDMVLPKESLFTRLKNNALSNQFHSNAVHIFCIIMIFGYIVSAFLFPQLWLMNNSIFYLQSAASVLCLMMLLNELWSAGKTRPKYLVFAWHSLLCFCLPCFISYVMFVYGGKVSLIASFILAVILLRVLTNAVMSVCLTFIGIGLGYAIFSIDSIAPNLDYNMFAVCSMSFMGVVMAMFLHNKKYVEKQVAAVLERTVSERTKELEKALRVKGTFLNNISHEVKIPVHSVINLAEYLDDEWDTLKEETKREMVKSIRSSKHRLVSFCDNILDLSKFRKGQKKLDIVRGNVDSFLDKFSMDCRCHHILDRISIKRADDLHNIVFFDEIEILAVVKSFVDNALKYGKDTPITIELKNQGKNGIKVSVSDKGQGIPVKELKKIFDPFEESSRTKTGAGGRGLSLAVCKEIIKAHNGKIWAENNKNGGSTFSFVIPLAA